MTKVTVNKNRVSCAGFEEPNNNGSGAVSSVSGTANQITASPTTGAVNLSLPSQVIFPGTVGIGATPQSLFTVSQQNTIIAPISGSIAQFVGLDGNPLRITFDTHNNANASGTALMFRRSRGTAGIPLALSADDDMGSFNARGYGTTGYAASSTGLISFKANQIFTDTNMGTYASIYTTPDNSVTAVERLRVAGSGILTASGYTTNNGILYTNGSGVVSQATVGSLPGLGTGVGTWLVTPSWTNFNAAITGTAPFWLTTGSTTITGNTTQTGAFTNTFALNGLIVTQNALSSGWVNTLSITPGANTAYTSATEFIDYDFKNRSVTWIDGTVVAQRFIYFRGNTVNKTTTTATFTNIYNAYIDPSIAGSGVSFTNNWALGLGGNLALVGASPSLSAIGSGQFTIGNSVSSNLIFQTGGVTRITIGPTGNNNFLFAGAATGSGVTFLTFTQPSNTGGTNNGLVWTAGANTNGTVNTEITDINWNLSAVMKMLDGTVATQRAFRIQGRTYTPQTSALTLTEASTLEVSPSIAGSGTTITTNYAIKSTGNIGLATAGNGIWIKQGTNATCGRATLSGGTVTVSTTKATSTSEIFLTDRGGTITNLGTVYVSAVSSGTSFTITSTNVLDASTVSWIIIESAP